MKKVPQDPQTEIKELQELADRLEAQSSGIYGQINTLLLWKTSLKVKVNPSCPNQELVGIEGYVGDVFPDGITVWVPHTNDFYRFDAKYLDVIGWDGDRFLETMKNLDYVQVNGVWKHKSQI